MKPVSVSRNILPLAKFKSQASQVLRELRDSQQPVIITQNGSPAAVMITPEDFDLLTQRQRFVASVEAGLRDAVSGRTLSDEDVQIRLVQEFGELEE